MSASLATPDLAAEVSFSDLPSYGEATLVDAEELSNSIPRHPLGVKPSGNKYTTAASDDRAAIGNFEILSDEVLSIFLEYLDAESLRYLGYTSKALYAFCHADDLWKALIVERSAAEPCDFKWQGTWRSTYLSLDAETIPHISCDSLFSDVIYRPFLCAHTPLAMYTSNIPLKNTIARLGNISPEEFERSWYDKPFVLTNPVQEWPIYKTWDTAKLLDDFADTCFRAEAVDLSLRVYVEYMSKNTDESPLYLFDRDFVGKMGLSIGRHDPSASYWPPDCFGEDLFAVLGTQRPDSRWLIMGPARSGSTFHKDPNATSAWNAVLRGSKYWIMFPNDPDSPPPPGVYVSEDQSEVTSPLSIAEWLLSFHAEARNTAGCLEGICNEGEVLHVPSGWWHLVVNLEASIAITQNFVPRNHLPSVLSFLKDKPDQVSGFRREVQDPYATFVQRMGSQRPDLLSEAIATLKRKGEDRKRKWDAAIGGGEGQGFSFGFGGDGDSEEDVP